LGILKQRADYSTTAGRGDQMKKRLRMKITTVRERTVKVPDALIRAHCPSCNLEVEMFTRAHAARILQVSVAELSHLIAIGQVHTIETISGSLLVCKDSLLLR
jgi:hypothetical protein